MKKLLLLIVVIAAIAILAYLGLYRKEETARVLAYELNLPELKGVSIYASEELDKKYTCDGENVNPAIYMPERGIYAVIVEDPDAPGGTWFHWGIVMWNADVIPEGLPKALQGDYYFQTYNDFYYHGYIVGEIKGVGYDGPCPPPGHGYHRYYFQVFKLKSKPPPVKDKDELINFIRKNAEAVYIFIAKYKR